MEDKKLLKLILVSVFVIFMSLTILIFQSGYYNKDIKQLGSEDYVYLDYNNLSRLNLKNDDVKSIFVGSTDGFDCVKINKKRLNETHCY